ncbi:MAG: hypothetical protein NT013_00005, partial [Planctomycetia bacterium]|nr:hypothetical protein [Planctomycetia bacterium]
LVDTTTVPPNARQARCHSGLDSAECTTLRSLSRFLKLCQKVSYKQQPADGERIDRANLNRAQRLAVRFISVPGAIADVTTITDDAAEVVLSGAAAAGVTLGQPVRDVNDDQLYYYPFTGTFGVGPVSVQLVSAAFTDSQGNVNTEKNFSFTVTGPEMVLRNPVAGSRIDVLKLNQQGYLEVFVATSAGVAIDEASLTDAAPEFTLSGAGLGAVISGVGVPVAGEPNVYRYAIESPFTQTGSVAVEFLDGAIQDLDGVVSAAGTEAFLATGVTAALADPIAFDTTGLTLLNNRGYLDVKFIATNGATLDESTIFDAAAEFNVSGDGANDVVIVGTPTAVGDGVYRYAFTGQFVVGQVDVEYLPNAVTDSAGFQTTVGTEKFYLAAPTAELFNPSIGRRADRSTLNDHGYIDIQFQDRTGQGLDVSSIIDVGQEFTLLVKDEAGDWVAPRAAINGAAQQLDATTFRYYFSDFFNPGVVRVLFTAGTFQDLDGAQNLDAEQQFAVVNLLFIANFLAEF